MNAHIPNPQCRPKIHIHIRRPLNRRPDSQVRTQRAAMRIHPVFATSRINWPLARYAVVVIIPTAMLLCVGWLELVPYRWRREVAWLGVLGLITLDVIALWSVIVPYYYG